MKVLRGYVLIEQTMVKKKSKILLPGKASSDKDNFDTSVKIIQFGKDAEKKAKENGIKIGDIPILGQHTQYEGMKILEKTDDKIVSNHIIHINDIIGIDD